MKNLDSFHRDIKQCWVELEEFENLLRSHRFEHGFSQIIDWFWKIDDVKNTSQFRSIFGSENIEYQGILVIGRDEFLSELEKARLKWYLNRVVVDSRKVICKTFDQLARDIRHRLSQYPKIL